MANPRLRYAGKTRKFRVIDAQERLDAAGAALLSVVVVFLVATVLLILTPGVHGSNFSASDAGTAGKKSPKSFAGNLPITQLTEDEAILHALDRLAYGPRPGDVERIQKMGLEKWINEQLNFNSGDDPELDGKLSGFKTLRMSPEELLEKYPPPNQIAKQQGMTPDDYREQLRQQIQAKRQELRQQGED
ncbi:MAG: DUF1800 family protein, partial [Candidatus Acidiferrales bacterium]